MLLIDVVTFAPFPMNMNALSGALGANFLCVLRKKFMKPYVGSAGVGVRAAHHASEMSCRSRHLPLRSARCPKRAMSYALMYMPPPQCPPPLTDWTMLPSSTTYEFS